MRGREPDSHCPRELQEPEWLQKKEGIKCVITILAVVIIMLTILRSGYGKIMQFFYEQREEERSLT